MYDSSCFRMFINRETREIVYLVASVRPSVRMSVCPSVCALLFEEESLPVTSICLCVCNQWAYADSYADAVDQLLILHVTGLQYCTDLATGQTLTIQNLRFYIIHNIDQKLLA